MQVEGPSLERLTRRISECPADFLDEPRLGTSGRVHVDAVVADLIFAITGSRVAPIQLEAFARGDAKKDRNRMQIVLLAAWLLADPWFVQVGADKKTATVTADAVVKFLGDGAAELAAFAMSTKLVDDPDRREELARIVLARLGMRPAGESVAQAQDRLTTISTAERQRVIAAARGAEERARQIRELL